MSMTTMRAVRAGSRLRSARLIGNPSLPARTLCGVTDKRMKLRQRVPGRGWQTLVLDPETHGNQVSRPGGSVVAPHGFRHWAWHNILAGVFPQGYPETVTSNYTLYVQWTCVGLIAGRMQSVLATQAALFTIGLGAGAIPLAAAVQWILKDGVGHAGAIAYAAAVNTRFDADAKRYRFQSTIALTIADGIAVLMPLVPQHFFVMASLSSATSSIANLAQAAARARIMASFAKGGNLADCVRAGQTQSKLMSLLGTASGAGLSWLVGPEAQHVLGVMVPLAAISCYATHASSRIVVLRSLNVQRCERVYDDLLRTHVIPSRTASHMASPVPMHVPSQPWTTHALDAQRGKKAAAYGEAAVGEAAVGEVGEVGEAAVGEASERLTQWRALTPEATSAVETFALAYRSVMPATLLLQPPLSIHPLSTHRLLSSKPGHLQAALPLLEAAAAEAVAAEAAAARVAAAEGAAAGAADSFGEAAARGAGAGTRYSVAVAHGWHASWHDGYALASSRGVNGGPPIVALWYESAEEAAAEADAQTKLRAFWHASMVRCRLAQEVATEGELRPMLEECAHIAEATWPKVEAALIAAQWDLRTLYLDGAGGSLDRTL